MDKSSAIENSIIKFDLLSQNIIEKSEPNVTIYFVLSGTITVTFSGKVHVLKEKDFIIVNQFLPHCVEINPSCLAVMFFVNVAKISDYYDVSKLDFFGSSTQDEQGHHVALRILLEKCTAYYYGKQSDNGRILLKLHSIYFEIAELLVSSFSAVHSANKLNSEKEASELLIQEMISYIQVNYHSPLRLEDLAQRFFLSPTYISSFFKRKLGMNFTKYVTDIRLKEAMKKLELPDKSLTWIAMDCGFPTLASFNIAFKAKYGLSPKECRSALPTAIKKANTTEKTCSNAQFQLMEYFEKSNTVIEEEFIQIETIEADTGNYTVLTKNWNRMINLGGIYLLMQKEIQDHTVFLCKTLGFEYVRIWDLYDKRMHINAGDKNKKYNFNRLDVCLDFFMANRIKPYIELGFKPFVLLRDYENYTFNEERDIPFNSPKEYGGFIRTLLLHMVNRYGVQEISSWMFEIWCDPRWFPNGDVSVYLGYFEATYQALKEISPQAKLGGAYDRTYDIINFDSFIKKWSTHHVQPDFLSIYCYEILFRDYEKEAYGQNTVNLDHFKNFKTRHYLDAKKNALMRCGMNIPVYCSEWNFTVVNANVLNDSRFKGAYIIQNIMDIFQNVDLLGYWFGTDLFADEDDAPMLLNGRCGLITHQSICKPAYWAFYMMNRLEDYLLTKTNNVMVTMNDFDNYIIVCHNYQALGIQYYTQQEPNITIESQQYLYENNKKLTIKASITSARNGTYHIKKRIVNSQYGCVQDEWLRMGKTEFLTAADVEYIDHMSRPHITISQQNVTDNTIHFSTDLEAQEIQLIHIFRYLEA